MEGDSRRLFRGLYAFFLTAHAEIDWSRLPEFLDNALEELGDALPDFGSVNDWQTWLDAHPGRMN